MSTTARRKEVQRLRAEGAAAYEDGRHINTNPYRDSNAYQWRQGYEMAVPFDHGCSVCGAQQGA